MAFTVRRAARGVALALSIAALPWAQAQDMRVDVTGSNIKRVEGETGQPLQVITRQEIASTGATSAMELLDRLAINSAVGNYTLANAFGDSARIGFSGASLRGLGYKYTLVLLNGRRMANYAHDGTAIDVNAIPLSAIERIEVLKDGASAIYGTDAIGGVINFITRSDYRGAEASVYYGDTFDGGAREKSVSATIGFGDLAKDRWNAFVSMQWMKQEPLFGRDRPFMSSSYIPSEGLDSTSGRSFPGNVAIPGVGNRNPLYPNCAPSIVADPGVYPDQCRFDPNPFLGSLPEVEKFNLIARGAFQLTPDHQLFGEALYAKNEYRFVLQPVPIGTGVLFPASGPGAPGFVLQPTSPFYPHSFAALYGLDGQPLDVQWRAFDAGLRDSTTTAEQTRVVAGMKGVVKGWDYEAAYSFNESKDTDHLNGGYLSQAALLPIIGSGLVNPFGPNTPEIVSQLTGTAIQADVRSSKSTVNAFDAKISNEVYNLPAGPLAVALGGEWRKEKYNSVSSDILSTGDIVGYGTSSPTVTGDRKVFAIFAEAIVPIVRTLELDAAVRFDDYSDFGSTTNPKVSLRWQPSKSFLARASYGTGFRAPALPELLSPLVTTNTQPGLSDPTRCPITNDQVNDCVTQFVNVQGGNPGLTPEKSKQWSVGGVWEPLDGLSLGVDWYHIELKDQVGLLNPIVVLGDVDQYAAFITRGPVDPNFPLLPGPITAITTLFTNLGETRIEGIDIDARYRTPSTSIGRFRFGLQGTYYTKYDIQQIDGSFAGQVGLYSGIGGAINRWKHYASIDWEYGPWGATLAQNFGLGYTDANPDVNGNPRRVGNYDVYDVQGRWTGVKNLTVTLGIKNLFNRAPPFTNQSFTFQNGYDPSYADPRGAFWYANVGYKFF
ncbi:MAG: TonB-dependent receptor [Betaproteobacteria bacterium]